MTFRHKRHFSCRTFRPFICTVYACACACAGILVPWLMCDGKGKAKSSVFIYGAAAIFTAHPADWGKAYRAERGVESDWLTTWYQRCVRFCLKQHTQCVTWFILPGADIKACEENSVIVSLAVFTHQPWLPLTETVQCLISMVRDGETQLIQTVREKEQKR